jgi:hypothetical protein
MSEEQSTLGYSASAAISNWFNIHIVQPEIKKSCSQAWNLFYLQSRVSEYPLSVTKNLKLYGGYRSTLRVHQAGILLF